MMKKGVLKYLSLGGIIGPVLLTATTIMCGSLRPGYAHVSNVISELGATGTPHAELMNFAGFLPAGICIALFGISLILLLPGNILPKIGAVLITLFGLGVAMAGIFSCDPGCPMEGSQEAIIHDRASVLGFMAASLGTILIGFSFRKFPEWRGYWGYSIITGILAIVFLVLMINSAEARDYTGLWQRLFLLTIFQWLVAIGWQGFRKCMV